MIEIIIVNIQLTSLQNECFQELVKHDLKILRASRPPATSAAFPFHDLGRRRL